VLRDWKAAVAIFVQSALMYISMSAAMMVVDLICCVAMLSWTYTTFVGGRRFEDKNMEGKIVVVTGSNTGVGLETAREIARLGAEVILACRTPAKAEAAVVNIMKSLSGKAKVSWMRLDLCDFTSVRKFCDDFKEKYPRLDVLVNNAGMMQHYRRLTKDNYEMTLTANFLGPFLLTQLLLDHVKKSKDGRIVNVNSSLHHNASSFNFEDPHFENGYEMFKAYANSKLAQLLATKELQRKMDEEKSDITVVALNPGNCRTEVTRHMHWLMQIGDWMTYPVWLILRKSANQGASTSVHCATSPEVNGRGGEYFQHCDVIASSDVSHSKDEARKLWEFSCKLVKL